MGTGLLYNHGEGSEQRERAMTLERRSFQQVGLVVFNHASS